MVAQPASFRPSQTWSFKNSNMLPYAVFGATAVPEPPRRRVAARGPAGARGCAIPRGGACRARRRDRASRLTDADALTRALTGVRGACRQPAAVRASRPVRTADRIALTVARAAVAARVPAGCVVFGRRRSCQRQRLDTDEPDAEQRLSDSGIPRRCAGLFHGELDADDRTGRRHGGCHRSCPRGRLAMVAAATWAGAEFLCRNGRRARDHRVRPRPYSPEDVLARWPPNWASRCGWMRWRRTAGPGRWRGGFSPALEGFIEMTRGLNGHIGMDTDPAEHWAGSIPLARAVGGMARAVRARFPERVGAARADRNRPGMGRLMLYNATRRVFGSSINWTDLFDDSE